MGKESAHETVALNPDPKPDSLISTNIHAENDIIIGKSISMSENDHFPSLQSASELASFWMSVLSANPNIIKKFPAA